MKKAVILGAVCGLGLGCWRYDPTHCGNNLGDASCAEGTFCDGCQAENQGCVALMPSPECYIPGGAVDDDGVDESSSGTSVSDGSTGASSGSVSESSGSTSVGPQCLDDEDCAGSAAPFCGAQGECVSCAEMSDPDGACAGLDPTAGVCDAGACVQCTETQAAACVGPTPVCGANNVCIGCTEHSECPQSACHLDGENVGACFDVAAVQMIGNATELETALGAAGDEPVVLVLADGSYPVTIQVGGTAEIAVVGSGEPILSGDGLRVVDSFQDAILYFDGVQIVNPSGLGVSCSGRSVWLDDSAVRNNTQLGLDVFGDCGVHLRRSLVNFNNGGGIDIAGGELTAENSVIGLNGDELTSFVGGLRIDGAVVDITYSTIVGNEAADPPRGSVFCVGGESGEIRNSIIVGSGDSIDGCAGLSFSGNGVDDPDAATDGANVGPVMAAWFQDLAMSDFHLSSAGEDVFAGLASWRDGDPVVDIDGDGIPMEMNGFPGYDQP